eukprot:CAMPEP_0204340578 /NCGR_PEP_ID=MMETSP0469-20131031/22685_1 /ASSEMBLY_ACC=CAM_ASM_000384 /TAXON_ID=2969 /ORGANISM="Oxyrrhis marina" /LENGTH=210 /DNA_ID=CAMNT_0051325131 /DNA_START=32 /DNA_END=664 /DNA_ORIENTATION=-
MKFFSMSSWRTGGICQTCTKGGPALAGDGEIASSSRSAPAPPPTWAVSPEPPHRRTPTRLVPVDEPPTDLVSGLRHFLETIHKKLDKEIVRLIARPFSNRWLAHCVEHTVQFQREPGDATALEAAQAALLPDEAEAFPATIAVYLELPPGVVDHLIRRWQNVYEGCEECIMCLQPKLRMQFGAGQLKKAKGTRTCKDCIAVRRGPTVIVV